MCGIQKNEFQKLDPITFASVLVERLWNNLKTRKAKSDHFVWDFVVHNAELGAAILKLHGYPLNDESLKRCTKKDSLFTNSYLKSLECLSGRENSILDDIDDQVGAYMYEDEDGLGIIRAGSAAVGLRKRHKDHVKASIQETTTNLSSKFYTAYPDPGKNGQTKGTSGGTFRQLRQVTGVRFKASMKNQVIELFSWEEHVVKKLDQKKLSGAPRLVDKQHRMVCYFFEKMFDLMIGPDNNLSSNAGFESFTGDWNRAQVN